MTTDGLDKYNVAMPTATTAKVTSLYGCKCIGKCRRVFYPPPFPSWFSTPPHFRDPLAGFTSRLGAGHGDLWHLQQHADGFARPAACSSTASSSSSSCRSLRTGAI